MRTISILAAGILLGSTLGCATRPAPTPRAVAAAPAPEPPASPPRKTKVAILPVEKLLLPRVAEALNERLNKAQVNGMDEAAPAQISMEMAMLQSDCGEASEQCYGRVAKRLEADRLLWGEIEQPKVKKKKSTVVRVMLFDVASAKVVGRAEQTFPGNVSNEALDELLQRVTSDGTSAGVVPKPVQP
jgi:hypothetical protein